MKVGRIIYIVVLLLIPRLGIGQDVEYSQFFANKLFLNPAFAGTDNSRISLGYRTEMPNSLGDFVNYNFAYDMYSDPFHGGIGILIAGDKQGQGAISVFSIDLIYSYIFEYNHELTFSGALQVGYYNRKIDASGLIFPDMIDPNTGISGITTENFTTLQTYYLDFTAGVLGWYRNTYFSLSVSHLTKPKISSDEQVNIEQLNRKYSLLIGTSLEFYNTIYKLDWILSPVILYQHQGSSDKINLGLYFIKDYISAGIWTRHALDFSLDAIIPIVGVSNKIISLSYSYDIPVYKYEENNLLWGAHEVTFLYNFQYKSKRKRIKAIKCPKF